MLSSLLIMTKLFFLQDHPDSQGHYKALTTACGVSIGSICYDLQVLAENRKASLSSLFDGSNLSTYLHEGLQTASYSPSRPRLVHHDREQKKSSLLFLREVCSSIMRMNTGSIHDSAVYFLPLL